MIADVNHVRVVGNLTKALGDDQILPHLRNARRRLISWVGQAIYDAAEAEAETAGDPRDFADAELGLAQSTIDLADAEAYLALAAGIPSFNMAMQQSGAGAVGIHTSGVTGDTNFNLLIPGQEVAKAQEFLERALQAAQPYLIDTTAGGSPGPMLSHALDHDGDVIDENWPDSKLVNPL